MIVRTQYLDTLNMLINKNIITLVVGLRRVGKSTLLQQFIQQKDINNNAMLYIPLENFEYLHIRSQASFIELLKQYDMKAMQHLIIDEVQLVQGREEVINGLHASFPSINIIVTGSNSGLLSTEIATGLRGRVYQLYVHPFDIYEYGLYHKKEVGQKLMKDFLQQTGLPMIYQYDDKSYMVQELVNAVFLKDIVERYKIRDVDLLRSIFSFIVSNTANITNLSNIQGYLQNHGYHINLNTIGNYVTYLKNSLLIHECNLYDMQGKKILHSKKKFYAADHGLRNYLFSRFDLGKGKQLENYIYLQLIKAGYSVFTGRINNVEVDFIAEKNNKKIYVQVAWSLDSEKVYNREFGNLENIQDNRNKYVVSMDTHTIGSINNIQHIQAWDFSNIL